MANRTLSMTDEIWTYLVGVSVDEPDVMARLRAETANMPGAVMQVGPEQGAFMTWLVRLMRVRNAIEIGTFTGYSALAVARALPADGLLVCCEVEQSYADIAQRYFREAGLDARIDLRVAPARSTLDALVDGGEKTFDFAFIDADKAGYDDYYERCLTLVRASGVIALDNALWEGKVADPSADDESTRALRSMNEKVFADERVDACLLPIGDGLTLARKR